MHSAFVATKKDAIAKPYSGWLRLLDDHVVVQNMGPDITGMRL